MPKMVFKIALYCSIFCLLGMAAFSQKPPEQRDTFFLAKKKGLIGRLGQSMNTDGIDAVPVAFVNPYLVHTGKIIRHIHTLRLGFERDINDTTKFNNSFGTAIANGFHRRTTSTVLKNNLFFAENDKLNPYLLADNERNLREQPFVQDARIRVQKIPGCQDSVDIVVMEKDVFSLGGGFGLDFDIGKFKINKLNIDVREENLAGSGSRLLFRTYFDANRTPSWGYGGEFLKRNIGGSFVNWTVGFQNFKPAYNSGRNEETAIYTYFEKPLVSPYIPWTGALYLSYNKTSNNYFPGDSIYVKDFKYNYHIADGWWGYNFGSERLKYRNMQTRLRKFIAVRGVYQHFNAVPLVTDNIYSYGYANLTAVLAAFTIFKQDFYRTNFIYGFGRNEDVPQGFSASVIGGWTKRQEGPLLLGLSRDRPYYGTEAQSNRYNKKGFYSSYIFRMGGYYHDKHFEDFNILFNVEHFTRLRKINSQWYNRYFISGGFAKQINTVLNAPLVLRSDFGLPYFDNGSVSADNRATVKSEAVYYHMRKFVGFRIAPFVFADLSVVTPQFEPLKKSDLYSAIGAGVRTRNENLVYGTIELKGYFFPRTMEGMKPWRVELNSNIRFKYNSVFIRRPDFVLPN